MGGPEDSEVGSPEEAQGGRQECLHTMEHGELCPLKGAFPESPGLHPNPTNCSHQHLLLGGELENFITPRWPNCALLINGKIKSHNSVPSTPSTLLNHRRWHACDYGDWRWPLESHRGHRSPSPSALCWSAHSWLSVTSRGESLPDPGQLFLQSTVR